MEGWAALIAALLEAGLRLLERLDAERAAGFRRRAASDGTGVLLAQLNPGGDSAPARTEQSAEHGPERAGGRVDEQR
ncbi:hypothetical protein [Mailhella massiliensis]|uniref:hypothetical protein n=1 Tax=Mailhella massiliensis TaxID=1903261 RepID=UPI001185EEBF|nr:hypothetical protein [Mailhella massiliensis]